MAKATAKIQAVLSFVEAILQFFLAKGITERLQVCELADCVSIQLIDACKSFLTDSLLVVGQEQSSELFSLEKILTVVLRLRHSKHILMCIGLVLTRDVELKPYSRRSRRQCLVFSASIRLLMWWNG